jgi:hypothetical protein
MRPQSNPGRLAQPELTCRSVKRLTRLLTRYGVTWPLLNSLGLAVSLALSLAALGYFLLQAPVYCGAEIRTGQPCRKNSHGILRGCSIFSRVESGRLQVRTSSSRQQRTGLGEG